MGRPKSLGETLPILNRMLRNFWPYIRKERSLIFLSLLALFAGIGLRLLDPWPMKVVFDRVIHVKQHHQSTHVKLIDSLDSITLLAVAAISLVLINGLRAMADYLNTIGFALIGNRVLTQVRNALYRHLQCLSLAFHNKARGGDLTVRMTGDIHMLRDITVTAVLPLCANALIMTAMLGLMLWLNWKLTLLALAPIPLLWFSTIRITSRIHDAARKQRQREGALAATAAESITAIKIVQALSLQRMFEKFFLTQSQKSQAEEMRGTRLSAGLERTVDLYFAISSAIALFYGTKLVLTQTLTPGDLLVFLTYLKRTFNPMQDFAKYTGRLAKAAAAGERIVDLLEREPEVADLPDSVPAPEFRGRVQFFKVNFAYDQGRPVLEDINLIVEPGVHIAFVGPSGIGKSTLMSLILRLYDPTAGSVRIDGVDIRKYTLESLRSQISIVLQDSWLFAASVWDNIAYGAAGASREEIEAAARLANAHGFILELPQQYDTILGERGVTLSHGQRQRIAIARAAIRKAPILILDEPTTGLDEENEQMVIEALERLSLGRTTFLVTHNLQFASRSSSIVYLDSGHISECGSHEDLLQANGRYSTLYRLQGSVWNQSPGEGHAPTS